MLQHLLLMLVAPPLLWLGAPWLPLLQGLPRGFLRTWLRPLFAWRALARLWRWLGYPPLAWAVYVGSLWAWHTPGLYERALASEFWHEVQHASFLVTALAFWWPVLQPWPSRPRVRPWGIVCYLILADLQSTVLCAWLVFAERLLYPSYAAVPLLRGISALDDQAAAGAIMWVPGSVALLVPVAWIVGQMLNPQWAQDATVSHQHTAVDSVRGHGSGNGGG
jgi:cytochrome c oxidase assembly factor CtaG